MAATLGKIEEFDGKKEEWVQYVERLSHFFIANGIKTEEKKRAVFLSLIGPSIYKISLVPRLFSLLAEGRVW